VPQPRCGATIAARDRKQPVPQPRSGATIGHATAWSPCRSRPNRRLPPSEAATAQRALAEMASLVGGLATSV
jgi:hypothetical protein